MLSVHCLPLTREDQVEMRVGECACCGRAVRLSEPQRAKISAAQPLRTLCTDCWERDIFQEGVRLARQKGHDAFFQRTASGSVAAGTCEGCRQRGTITHVMSSEPAYEGPLFESLCADRKTGQGPYDAARKEGLAALFLGWRREQNPYRKPLQPTGKPTKWGAWDSAFMLHPRTFDILLDNYGERHFGAAEWRAKVKYAYRLFETAGVDLKRLDVRNAARFFIIMSNNERSTA